jgi:hypothetical protein
MVRRSHMDDVDAHDRVPNMVLRTSVLALLCILSFIVVPGASLTEFEHAWELASQVMV